MHHELHPPTPSPPHPLTPCYSTFLELWDRLIASDGNPAVAAAAATEAAEVICQRQVKEAERAATERLSMVVKPTRQRRR